MALTEGSGVQQKINAAFGLRFNLDAPRKPTLRAEMQSYARFGPLQLADLTFSAHRTRPLPGNRRGSGGAVLISALSRGACQVRQGGQIARAQAGDVFLLDVDQWFELHTTEMETRALLVETGFLRRHFPDYARFSGGVLPGDTSLGRLARSLLDETAAAAARGEAQVARGLAASFLQFLGAALLSVAGGQGPADTIDPRLLALQEHLRNSLADPALNVAAMARFLRLGERQVHHLFASQGTTPARWLKRERLAMIARDLRNPRLRGRPVSAIAFDWGYSDAAHFSRSFRAAFGMPPVVWRRTFAGQADDGSILEAVPLTGAENLTAPPA